MSAFIITRIQVGDYDTWRAMFDQDRPGVREKAKVQRVFRGVDDPNHVFILLDSPPWTMRTRRNVAWSSRACSTASRTSMGRTSLRRRQTDPVSNTTRLALDWVRRHGLGDVAVRQL
jgi:hypothetical protein